VMLRRKAMCRAARPVGIPSRELRSAGRQLVRVERLRWTIDDRSPG
jgi:hypothetical protein